MKPPILIFLFGLLIVFAALSKAEDKKTEVCMHLDDKTDFSRCATSEVICYTSKGGMSCWPMPAPEKTPEPRPNASTVKSSK